MQARGQDHSKWRGGRQTTVLAELEGAPAGRRKVSLGKGWTRGAGGWACVSDCYLDFTASREWGWPEDESHASQAAVISRAAPHTMPAEIYGRGATRRGCRRHALPASLLSRQHTMLRLAPAFIFGAHSPTMKRTRRDGLMKMRVTDDVGMRRPGCWYWQNAGV